MSATNRGAKRVESDFYATPKHVVESILNEIELSGDILEPTAGNGNIAEVIKKHYPENRLDVVELREEERKNLEKIGADNVIIHDFLTWQTDEKYDTIITNPPYSIAEEIITKCFKHLKPGGKIIMLLRLNFLGAKKRFQFWQEHPVDSVYVLSNRPSFTGNGTDATEYAWFVWGGKKEGVKVIWGK